ncbi:MAG: MFS transporter [Clostridia bacterium]|nr:MFS transporter [Clostridia bacterium]
MVLLLVVIYITFISLGLPDSLFGVAWPLVHLDFGLPESFGSLYSIIIAFSTGGVSFFAGPLIKKFGTGWVTAVSVILTAIGLLGISFAPNIYVMIACAIVSGLGAGAIDTGLNNFVSLHYKAIHMNWLHCFWGVGVTVSPLIMSVFLKGGEWKMGYRAVSFIQFGIAIIVFISLFLWRKYDKREPESAVYVQDEQVKKEKISIKKMLLSPGVITGILSLGFYCIVEFLMGTWGASYLVNARGMDVDKAAQMVSIYYGGIMIGRFISGIVSLKVNDKNLIRGGASILLLGVIMLAIPNEITIYIGMLLIGVGCGPIFPSTLHSVPLRHGAELSTYVTGYYMTGAYTIGFLTQVVFGYVATALSFEIMPYIMICIVGIMLVLVEVTNKKTAKEIVNG